jgi:hypothetical protein
MNPHFSKDIMEEEQINDAPTPTLEPIGEDTPVIGNMNDVAQQIRQVRQNENDIAQFKQQADEAAEFYATRILALDQRNDFLKENVGRWLKLNGLNSLATHAGTIGFTKRTKVTLPADDVLLAFINEQDEQFRVALKKTTESPIKDALKKYIESTGKEPEGYVSQKVESISIRKAA